MRPWASFLEGLDRWRKHLPEARTFWGVLGLLVIPVILFLLVSQFFIMLDVFGGIWILDAEVLALTLAFLTLYLFFRLKEPLIQRFGDAAYSLGFRRFILPALTILTAVIVRIRFIGGPEIPVWLLKPVGYILGWYLIAVGVLLWLRSVVALGIDSLTMTYVYFPDEGVRTESAIYSLMRHPIYAAALRIALGLALLNGSWFALTLALILGLYLWGWVRLVEEPELIQRFGPSYAEYRKRTPPFWPRLQDLGQYFKFLIMGD